MKTFREVLKFIFAALAAVGIFLSPIVAIVSIVSVVGMLIEDLIEQQKITNALLVEQLLLLTEEEELECGGDCEQCICGKL